MRTTLNLNDDLVKEAMDSTGIKEKTALLHAGLKALISYHAALRLAALGGSAPRFEAGRRRRTRESK